MAIIKSILHKKNSSGAYDDIYLRTRVDNILMTDNSTLLSTYLNSLSSGSGLNVQTISINKTWSSVQTATVTAWSSSNNIIFYLLEVSSCLIGAHYSDSTAINLNQKNWGLTNIIGFHYPGETGTIRGHSVSDEDCDITLNFTESGITLVPATYRWVHILKATGYAFYI